MAEGALLDSGKFVIFKLEAAAHINVKGEKCQCYLGLHAGVIVFDQGVVAENIDYSTVHIASYENRPRITEGGILV